MAGSEYSGLDLGTVIRLSVIILFNNDQRNRFDLLVSGESLAAYVRRAIAAQMERDGLPESERIPATIEQATARRKEQEEQAAKL